MDKVAQFRVLCPETGNVRVLGGIGCVTKTRFDLSRAVFFPFFGLGESMTIYQRYTALWSENLCMTKGGTVKPDDFDSRGDFRAPT